MANMYYVPYAAYVNYNSYVEYAKYETPISILNPRFAYGPPCFDITNMQQICKICAEYGLPLFLYAKQYIM